MEIAMRKAIFNDWSLSVPDGWSDNSTVLLLGPVEGEARPTVTVTREVVTGSVSPKEYAIGQLPALKQELEPFGFDLLSESETKIGASRRDCFQRTYRVGPVGSEQQVEQWQVYVVNGTDAITITCTHKVALFPKLLPIFRAVVQSFAFL
jgi:hypothetical protein